MKEYRVTVDEEGTTCWFNKDGQLHREDGPAKVYVDGRNYWYISGIELTEEEFNETVRWLNKDVQQHREDGLAMECADGDINGIELTEEEFNKRNEIELTLEEIANKFEIDVNNLKIKK